MRAADGLVQRCPKIKSLSFYPVAGPRPHNMYCKDAIEKLRDGFTVLTGSTP